MAANILASGIDLDSVFAQHVSADAAHLTGYQISGADIYNRYDPLSSPAQVNLGSRIPAISIHTSSSGWSSGTDLASIFCGHPSRYSLTTPSGGSKNSGGGWTSPKTWTHTLTATFASASALTDYFYYGGRIQISGNQGSGTIADAALANMFVDMGTIIIYDQGHYQTGAGGTLTNSGTGGANIGTTPVALYNTTDGSPYLGSTYSISMVANAAAGSATVITITTILDIITAGVTDTYSGTYTSNIQQRNYPTMAVPTFGGSMV